MPASVEDHLDVPIFFCKDDLIIPLNESLLKTLLRIVQKVAIIKKEAKNPRKISMTYFLECFF